MGFLDHLPECFTACSIPPKETRMPKQTVNIRVIMDCEGCAGKVTNAVKDLEGVESVDVSLKQQRLTVTGYVDPMEVLEEGKKTGKTAEIWPFVPHNLVTFPFVSGAYDIEAPTGFVRNVPAAIGDPKSPEMKLMVLFNDDNPSACSLM